jgi:hypothetical protein
MNPFAGMSGIIIWETAGRPCRKNPDLAGSHEDSFSVDNTAARQKRYSRQTGEAADARGTHLLDDPGGEGRQHMTQPSALVLDGDPADKLVKSAF